MKRLLFMLLVCHIYALAYGQDVNNELLKKLVEKQVLTQSEADEIQKESAPEEKKNTASLSAEKIRQAFNTPYMRFAGYGLFMYRYSDVAPIRHSAEPRVIFLSMRGELVNNIKYYILADFVNPMPFEFYGEWTPSAVFSVKLGQMKTPLSLENQLSLSDLETVLNTRSVGALIGMADDVQRLQNGKNNTGRDVGVMAYGSFLKTRTHDLLQYSIGLFQGTGINTPETNNSKDFATNIMLQPVKDFRVGGGVYFGDAYYSLDETVTPKGDHVHNRWIVSADYKSDRLYARTEWIHGNDGGIMKEGLYGTALWFLRPKKLSVFAKVDYFNKDKSIDCEVVDYTSGINYYFYPQCRLQLNHTYSEYDTKWNKPNSNVVMGQLQFVF